MADRKEESDPVVSPSRDDREKSTRSRQPNVRLDSVEVIREQLTGLRHARGGVLSAVSAKRREIDELLVNPSNLELVRSRFDHVQGLFEKFVRVHQDVEDLLKDDVEELANSAEYFTGIRDSFTFFCQKIKDWLCVTEAKFEDVQVNPEDSVSQVRTAMSKRSASRKSKIASHASGSKASSRVSGASSLSSVRAREAMRRAELEAEAHAIKQKHSLEAEESRIQHEARMLKLKKEELALETEMAKAQAREEVLAKLEKEEELKPYLTPLNPLASEWPRRRSPSPVPTPAPLPPAKTHVSSVSLDSPTTTNQILQQQNQIMQEIIAQQQRVTLPKWQVPTFQGNPLEFRRFVTAFDAMIETREPDFTSRLYYLEQFTSGHAKELVRSCQHMKPEEGYNKARSLLREKFGQRHKLAMAYIERVLSAEPVKSEDLGGLETFSILLSSCKNSLKAIDYLHKIENPETMKKIIEKLPFKMQERWRDLADDVMNVKHRDVTVEDISNFVDKRVRAMTNPVFGKLSSRQPPAAKGPKAKTTAPVGNVSFAANSSVEEEKGTGTQVQPKSKSNEDRKKMCPVCEVAEHYVSDCPKFKEKSVKDRFSLARQLKLCFGCLKRGHTTKTCFKKKPCTQCDRKHSSLLHDPSPAKRETEEKKAEETQVHCGLVNGEDQFCGLTGAGHDVAALPVVSLKVRLQDSPVIIRTNALLDSGSNSTFCSQSLMERLGAQSESIKLKLTTLGSQEEIDCHLIRNLEVADLDENKFIPLREVFSRPSIPVSPEEIPTMHDVERWSHLQGHVQLNTLQSEVGLLIGVNVPEALEPKEIIPSRNGGPYATKTELGWTINGPTGRKNSSSACFFLKSELHPMCISCTDFLDVYDDSKTAPSREDMKFMEIVEGSIQQEEDLHYKIALPLRDPEETFPNNQALAERRMSHLKQKFQKQGKFKEDYTAFIEDLLRKGYAEKVPPDEDCEEKNKVWYLPHHGIYHPKKPEKIRVVFDCSAKFRGVSLNDRLLQGPDLTNSLVGVLTRFRLEPVAVMADVEAMFHQVRVRESDRSLLRFLWWPEGDLNADYKEYQMSVHLFGATSSPSCANFAMRQHAENSKQEFGPDVVETVLHNFYVDDCLKSLPDTEAAVNHVSSLDNLMKKGGFRLTKWVSNDRKVLETIPEADRAKEVKNLDLSNDTLPVERALGVEWCVETDTFRCTIASKEKPLTRRGMLSVTSSIYDPLGMVAPFVLPAKVILQDLCRLGLGWDDPIPDELLFKWEKWLASLPDLSNHSMSRCFKPPDFGTVVSTEIHHFSDASLAAYGTVSYLRLENDRGEVHCSFLMSKSRLAPLKKITVPRLELAAAAMSVRVNKILKAELSLPVDKVSFWTDSMTVLRYIQQENKRFHTYVGNRVSYIRNDSSPSQWNYVDTKSNPADDLSRGMSSEVFLSN